MRIRARARLTRREHPTAQPSRRPRRRLHRARRTKEHTNELRSTSRRDAGRAKADANRVRRSRLRTKHPRWERRLILRKESYRMGRSDVAVADAKTSQYYEFSAITIKKRSLALFFMRLPVFVPIIFMIPGWVNLNPHLTLTNTEADVLGSGGILCLYTVLSITPLITLAGAQWIAPLRRWYGIWFAVIGLADTTTAAITTDFAGG